MKIFQLSAFSFHRRPRRAALTLVELLVVISIIGMLAAMIYPVTRNAIGRARAAQCVDQLRQLGVAINVYAQDNNQRLPVVEPLPSSPVVATNPLPRLRDALFKHAGSSEKVFQCPRDLTRWPVEGQSYEWCYPYGNDLIDVPKAWIFARPPDKATLLWDYDNVHNDQGGPLTKNVLFGDGHVKGI